MFTSWSSTVGAYSLHSFRRGIASQLLTARGPVQVDRVFTLTGASDEVLIADLDPTEPSQAPLGAVA